MERVRLSFPVDEVMHRHPLTVRITDMNYGRHLGHDALISLLHEARVAALASRGLHEWDLGGFPCVAADLAVQYQAETRWPDALAVETAIPAPARKAIGVYHRILREADDVTVATARINLMLIDPATGRPVAIPEALRDTLAGAR
ncbi:thioesterase family protein [Halomonas saccharevitans]|uniref:Thioesterase family protein n=1 Tax=Halomonas saccharevitans TaxID=416872 RepID=A0ABU3NGE5_9GAMM|nr:thioesterase family protein [Halomonas saccharevitans]MDT8880239.1 thioesterase family protein [Halomonas saccharevitans]